MKIFKIKSRKVWHISGSYYHSYCGNGRTFSTSKDDEYNPRVDESYVDVFNTDEIPHDIHGNLCKACVMHAFDNGEVRIIANNSKEGK